MGRKSSAKYKRDILIGKIAKALELNIYTINETKKWGIHALDIKLNHIHIHLSATPSDSPTNIVKILKGVTARRLFIEFPDLKEKLWMGSLWYPNYYIATEGIVSDETIKEHIKDK